MKLVLLILLVCLATVGASAQNKPNVVIMLGDNVGYGDIGAYGAGEIRGMPTPRIDSIAAQGLRLDAVSRRAGLHTIACGTDERALFAAARIEFRHSRRDAEYATGKQ
jgi:hypothetical protein